MADTFREREQGEEAKYKLDEEMQFKIHCRQAKLFGLWVSSLLGLDGIEANSYARNLVRSALDSPDPDAVVRRVTTDLSAAHVVVPADELVAEFTRFAVEAEAQLHDAFPTALDRDHAHVLE